MAKSYVGHSGPIGRESNMAPTVIAELRQDLRSLGYLHSGVHGRWTDRLDDAVLALRIDLTGAAGLDIVRAFNGDNRIVPDPEHPATIEPDFAAVIAQMVDSPTFVKLPKSLVPSADNKSAIDAVNSIKNGLAPTPFLLAMFRQESASRHYYVPSATDDDAFVVIGLDRNDKRSPKRITSRGYGLGQYTIKNHPPTAAERDGFILDPIQNVALAFSKFREKFDRFVVSANSSLRADDRMAEFPLSPLRICRFSKEDTRYMSDCRACAAAATKRTITKGQPVYPGSSTLFGPSKYYTDAQYSSVPDRREFGCDWPYAARRYNGSGINSYHYQFRILKNLLLV